MNICLTGASGGIGTALARALVADGHRVWGIARTPEALGTLQAALPAGMFLFSIVDVADAATVARWADELRSSSFVPDCVILNASVQHDDMKDNYDHALGCETLQVNLEGALRCIEIFLPQFREKRAGRFIAVTSTIVLRPSQRSAAYAASKAGLDMAMRSFALRYSRNGIYFDRVCLGPIATPMWEGKKSWLVPDPASAAAAITRFVRRRRNILYYPFLSTFLLRLSLCLPDRLFAAVSSRILK